MREMEGMDRALELTRVPRPVKGISSRRSENMPVEQFMSYEPSGSSSRPDGRGYEIDMGRRNAFSSLFSPGRIIGNS
jgi:hypothetical protein